MFDIDLLTTEAIELLCQLIATPRTSRDEAAAADVFTHFIEGKKYADDGSELFSWHRDANNIWCIACDYKAERPTLLLNAHIDTVKPVAAWTYDPFSPTIEEGRLYGLGSNDDGASLVCLFQTFRVLCTRPQTYNLIFLASAEEEVSGHDGIERALKHLPPIDVAIVGEPTGMQPAIAEKGLMVLDCTTMGKAGHAARNEGINAIYRALPDIEWFHRFHFDRESQLLGPVKMNVTIINAGTQHNVVPDRCTFTVDVRSNECYTNKEIYNKVCASVKSDVAVRSFRLGSSRIDPSHPLVQRAIALGPTTDGRPRTPFGSPTLSDQALMSCPSMKMGPGDSARSHTANEYICLHEIRDAIQDYLTLLDGYDQTIMPS